MPVVVVVRRIARFHDGFGELMERLEHFEETWLPLEFFYFGRRGIYFNVRNYNSVHFGDFEKRFETKFGFVGIFTFGT